MPFVIEATQQGKLPLPASYPECKSYYAQKLYGEAYRALLGQNDPGRRKQLHVEQLMPIGGRIRAGKPDHTILHPVPRSVPADGQPQCPRAESAENPHSTDCHSLHYQNNAEFRLGKVQQSEENARYKDCQPERKITAKVLENIATKSQFLYETGGSSKDQAEQ
jgi:hypothetical protein